MQKEDDWRLTNQERYLVGVSLTFMQYHPDSTSSDHDHCEFCWAKFMQIEGGDFETVGYASQDGRWVCRSCFRDFRVRFGWRVLIQLPPEAIGPVDRALAYWLDRWDWECPSLFGLNMQEFAAVRESWPVGLEGGSPTAIMAAHGALRELLHGASAPPPPRVLGILGITHEEAKRIFAILPSPA